MRFDIEGFITFDTEDASLVNLLTGDCIELSQTSTRLLAELLNHRGDILSRSEIFQSVFDKYGARASNSNLNQYVSSLRRNLSELGVEKEIIVTVPRIGFKIADDANINNDREYRTPFIEESVPEQPGETPRPRHGSLIIRVVILIAAIAVLLLTPEDFTVRGDANKLVHQSCVIFGPAAISLQNVTDNYRSISQPFDCSHDKTIYTQRQKINGTLGTMMQLLIVECEKGNEHCVSFYLREKNNA
ncbi:winged helix-turn-helix domain-containing protein [Intestinirhabdus alba]|uniref:Winged helix family transcriptional regulator n=1 Tax=Intestinirhabdus alba TaxID=2899544 RepID=A0A6L6IKN7_9ENTR|nr:helix-turn-helix domain-containing protein [Intestinirhabdus alba]MTH47119.1 winged helix family transcriptional regulator [Intestinirhabdus alba]